jgi:hypothetical protein
MTDTAIATISTIPPQYRGRVLTRGTEAIAVSLFTLQLVLSLTGSFAPAALTVLLGFRFFPDSFIPVLVGLGLGGLTGWWLIGLTLRHPWSSWYMFWKTHSEFRQRPDPIVDPNNPDAILLEIIPRRNWETVGLGTAEDQGFLLLDADKRQLLFEGDQKRYRIPAEALLSCETEIITKNWQHNQPAPPIAVVVIRFRESGGLGEREAPLRPMRTVGGDPLGGNYLERAHELERRIQDVLAVPAGTV